MAGDERARRIRVEHDWRRDDAEVSRLPDRRAAIAPWPHRHAPECARGAPARRRSRDRAQRRRTDRRSARGSRGASPPRLPTRARIAGVGVRGRRHPAVQAGADAVRPEQRAPELSSRGGRPGRGRAAAATPHALPTARGAGDVTSTTAEQRGAGRRATGGVPAGRVATAADPLPRRREHLHGRGAAHRRSDLQGGAGPRVRVGGRGLEPGRVLDAAARGSGGRARRLERALAGGRLADAARGGGRRARSAPDAAHTRGSPDVRCRRRAAHRGRRSVRDHAGGARGRRGASARRGRRDAHRDRGLSLVHRLGPRHDDQSRRTDALHGAASRGGVHPPHLRALRARRSHPQHVPGRLARGPLSHRRRLAVVLPRRLSVPALAARPAHARRGTAAPARDRRVAHPRDALRHRRRPRRRPADAGRRGIPADVDGCEGRRLGRDAAARQGGGDQRALVQRTHVAGGLARRARRTDGGSGSQDARRPGTELVQPTLLVRGRGVPVRHRRHARRRGRPGLPSQSAVRHLARLPGARRGTLAGGAGDGSHATAHAGGPALAGAVTSRLQGALLWRPPGARRGLPPGDGVGLAHRALRRRVAAGAPGRCRGSARLSHRVDRASRHLRGRQHRRDLRRRAAVHAAGMHRASVECGGGASSVDADSVFSPQWSSRAVSTSRPCRRRPEPTAPGCSPSSRR